MPEDVRPQPVTTAQDFQASVLAKTKEEQEALDRKRSAGAVDGTGLKSLNVNTTLTPRMYAIKEKAVKINQAQYSRSEKKPVKNLHVKSVKVRANRGTIPPRDREEDTSVVSVTRAYDYHPG